MTPSHSLYRQVLGPTFDLLPTELRHFHDIAGHVKLSGRCSITGPKTLTGKLMAAIFSLPKSADDIALQFELHASSTSEIWCRHFPGKPMRSQMMVINGKVVERLGPVKLHFNLLANETRLTMELLRITLLGIPCPRWFFPAVVAQETASPGKLHFDVAAQLPVVGMLVAYRGYLDLNTIEVLK